MDDEEGGNEPQQQQQGKVFTEEELNKFLERERTKLHGRLEKATNAQAEMKKQLDELQAAQREREAAEQQARDEAAAAQRKLDEAELSAKELIDRRTAEFQASQRELEDKWAGQVSTLQQQLAEREAVFAREREFQELARYAQDQVNANAEQIAPELVRYVGKNCTTKEEIDASIAEAIEATTSILAGIQNAQQTARAQMPGVSTAGFTPTGPVDNPGGPKQWTAEEIAAMSPQEFAKHRAEFGVTGGGNNRGLFG